ARAAAGVRSLRGTLTTGAARGVACGRIEARMIDAAIEATLDACLSGRELSVEDALPLMSATGPALYALCMTADRLRAEQVGETVTYVVNRNINFTNVCIKHCGFCAFSRTHRSDE